MKILNKVKKLGLKVINKIKKMYLKHKNRDEIQSLIKQLNCDNKPLIIFLNVVDWNIPLFQRPQHIARCMAKQGYNYLFFTGNVYDNVLTYERREDNLYIINAMYLNEVINAISIKDKYIHLYSTDMNTTNKQIDDYISKKYKILYEYIDEISPELYGNEIPQKAWEKHIRLLKDINIYVVCTARKLYEEALSLRKNVNLELITNGVEYNHFASKLERCPIQEIVDKKKPIIGYFGALAKWFDYELVEELAKQRSEYEILLIGWKYDESIKSSSIEKYSNITVIGPIEYSILPRYAQFFDVSTIPFKINEITESTSPIKLFEYMALGKPIVTTAMPECKLYKSVLIAKDKVDFIHKIDESLKLREQKDYLKILKEEALENTWESKAKHIINLLENKEV